MAHSAQNVRDWLGYLSQSELDALRELTLTLPPSPKVVNLGAGGGTSGLLFAETRSDLELWTVDIQKEGSPLGSLASEETVLRNAGLWGQGRLHQIHGDSTEAGLAWKGPPLDLIFHDSDHSYEKVKVDIVAWALHLRRASLFAFHDYGDDRHPGVQQAVDETLAGAQRTLLVDHLVVFYLP